MWAEAGDVTTNVDLTFNGSATFTANKSYTYAKGTGEVLSSATGTVWNDGGSSDRIGLKLNGEQLVMSNGNMTINFDGAAAGIKDIVTIEFDLAYLYQYSDKTDRTFEFSASAGSTEVVKESFNFNKGTMTSSTMGLTTDYIKYGASTTDWANKVHFVLTFNYETQKIKMTTACSTATKTSGEFNIDMPENTGALTKFYISCASANYEGGRYAIFDNLTVKTTEGDYSTTANITLAFEDGDGADISGLYTGETEFTPEKGSIFTPSNYYPTAMYDGDYKYTYTSGGDAFEVTTDAEVTLVYTKSARPTHTVTVTANYGGKNKTIVDGVSVQEASDYTYYYPRFIKDGNTLYEYASSTDPGASASYWTSTTTVGTSNVSYTLTYNALDGTCVYYAEGEDIAGATEWAFGDYKPYMSNGNSGAITSATTITTLDAGVYSVTARAIGRANDRYVDIFKTSADEENKVLHVTSQNKGAENTANFTLTGSTDIIALGGYAGGSSGHACDYIYIMQLPTSVSKEITSAGWATYCSPYALDLANATGLTNAYIVTGGDGTYVTTKPVSELIGTVSGTVSGTVPANTGLLLKGAEGIVTIPVVASSDTDVSANRLVGVVTAGTILAANAGWVLLKEDEVVGFYKNEDNAFTLNANTAYLPVGFDDGGGTAPKFLAIDNDGITGIKTIDNGQLTIDNCFDLQGRRVAQPTKGLYIVNGKKVVIK